MQSRPWSWDDAYVDASAGRAAVSGMTDSRHDSFDQQQRPVRRQRGSAAVSSLGSLHNHLQQVPQGQQQQLQQQQQHDHDTRDQTQQEQQAAPQPCEQVTRRKPKQHTLQHWPNSLHQGSQPVQNNAQQHRNTSWVLAFRRPQEQQQQPEQQQQQDASNRRPIPAHAPSQWHQLLPGCLAVALALVLIHLVQSLQHLMHATLLPAISTIQDTPAAITSRVAAGAAAATSSLSTAVVALPDTTAAAITGATASLTTAAASLPAAAAATLATAWAVLGSGATAVMMHMMSAAAAAAGAAGAADVTGAALWPSSPNIDTAANALVAFNSAATTVPPAATSALTAVPATGHAVPWLGATSAWQPPPATWAVMLQLLQQACQVAFSFAGAAAVMAGHLVLQLLLLVVVLRMGRVARRRARPGLHLWLMEREWRRFKSSNWYLSTNHLPRRATLPWLMHGARFFAGRQVRGGQPTRAEELRYLLTDARAKRAAAGPARAADFEPDSKWDGSKATAGSILAAALVALLEAVARALVGDPVGAAPSGSRGQAAPTSTAAAAEGAAASRVAAAAPDRAPPTATEGVVSRTTAVAAAAAAGSRRSFTGGAPTATAAAAAVAAGAGALPATPTQGVVSRPAPAAAASSRRSFGTAATAAPAAAPTAAVMGAQPPTATQGVARVPAAAAAAGASGSGAAAAAVAGGNAAGSSRPVLDRRHLSAAPQRMGWWEGIRRARAPGAAAAVGPGHVPGASAAAGLPPPASAATAAAAAVAPATAAVAAAAAAVAGAVASTSSAAALAAFPARPAAGAAAAGVARPQGHTRFSAADALADLPPSSHSSSSIRQWLSRGSGRKGAHTNSSGSGGNSSSKVGGSTSSQPAAAWPPVGDDGCPAVFICPLSHDVMVDPVMALDGWTYERALIQKWQRQSPRSPMTNQAMGSQLLPNHALRSSIQEWQLRRQQQ